MPKFKIGDKVVYDPDAEINSRIHLGQDEMEEIKSFDQLTIRGFFIGSLLFEENVGSWKKERFKLAETQSGFHVGDVVKCIDNSSLARDLQLGRSYVVTEVAPAWGPDCDSLFLKGIDGDYFCSKRFEKMASSFKKPMSNVESAMINGWSSLAGYTPNYTIKSDGSVIQHVENSAENVHVDDDMYSESTYDSGDDECLGCMCPSGAPPCSHCVNHINEDETVSCDGSSGLPESICHRCKHHNPRWQAPSPLWNQVMRGGSIDGPWKFNEIICPNCFIELAEKQNIADNWNLTARNVHVDVETVTPSGRVWNPITWLWDEPKASPGTPEEFAEPAALAARLRAFREGAGLFYADADKAADLIEDQASEIARHHKDFARWEEMADKGARQIERVKELEKQVLDNAELAASLIDDLKTLPLSRRAHIVKELSASISEDMDAFKAGVAGTSDYGLCTLA